MRWLMLVSSLDISDGGPPPAVLGLASALTDLGHTVCVVSHAHTDGSPHGDVSDAEARGVRLRWVPRRRATRFQFSHGLLTAALRESPQADAVVAHGFYQFTCVAAMIAARRARVPLMVQPHGVFEPYQERNSTAVKRVFQRLVGYRVLRSARAIVAASDSEMRGIRSSLGHRSPPMLLAGLGVDTTLTPYSGLDRFRTRNVLFLSRIAPKKRLDRLLGSATILSRRQRPIVLTVCGEGEAALVDRLRADVPPGVDVRWRGHVTGQQREEIESAQALMCLPSDNENFGQVVTEAMVRGIPVVTTSATGAAEHVRRADAGWVLDSPDASQLAACLETALSDPQELASMARRAVVYAQRELSWTAVAQRWADRAAEFST